MTAGDPAQPHRRLIQTQSYADVTEYTTHICTHVMPGCLSPSRVGQEGTRLWDAVQNLMTSDGRTPVQSSEFDSVRKLLTRLRRQRASAPHKICNTDILPHPLGCNASHPVGEQTTWLQSRVRSWLVENGPWTNRMQLPHSYTAGLAATPWHSPQGARSVSGNASDGSSYPEDDSDAYPFESLLRPLVDVLQRPTNVRRSDPRNPPTQSLLHAASTHSRTITL